MLNEMFKVAIRNIFAQKLRSFLVALGVAIGVVAVAGMITAAISLQGELKRSFSSLGPETFTVMRISPMNFMQGRRMRRMRKLWRRERLKLSYLEPLKKGCESCEKITPIVKYNRYASYGKKKITSVPIVGASPDFNGLGEYKIWVGRFITQFEVDRKRHVCVIGPSTAKELFGDSDPIGRRIKVAGIPFTVVGITEPLGKVFGQDKDNIIIVPVTTALHHWWGFWGITFIVKAKSGKLEQAKDEVVAVLRRLRHLKPAEENDFDIFTSDLMLKFFTSILAMVYAVGIGIALISLVVAGIGIMNVMFVAVSERTKEIGIRKACGATPKLIKLQFTIEAAVLAFLGGLLGLAFLSILIKFIAGKLPFQVSLNPKVVVFGLLFSFATGVLFGYFPARRASQLNPVDALRWE